ncbi:MAG TPA: prepilin peptidase, partial [Gemmataceae bacterium]|nr:prepilin peptidase [Gemmataceae bacterium]
MAILIQLPVILWTAWAFVLGACVGSLLNVCIVRLPLEKSIVWPSSRCGSCLRPIRWFDNIPLFSYWLLGGRCRNCGASFSIRYFFVELGTAIGFAGLFYLEIVANVHDLPFFRLRQWDIRNGWIPWQAWVYFGHHALLLSLLIVAAACDLAGRVIPLSLTTFGAGAGLVFAVLFPWPWPNTLTMPNILPPAGEEWWSLRPELNQLGRGLYPWPLWGPLPDWMPLGGPLAGLATGVAGILCGTWMLRLVRTVFTKGLGQEALGLGDADLMMMAGAFLGW